MSFQIHYAQSVRAVFQTTVAILLPPASQMDSARQCQGPGILSGLHGVYNQFGENGYLNIIESPGPLIQSISPFINVLDFSNQHFVVFTAYILVG